MPLELTTAALLAALAFVCASWLTLSRSSAAATPEADEWRSAALRHFHDHRELQTTVLRVASSEVVTGQARAQLLVAVGAPRLDTFA